VEYGGYVPETCVSHTSQDSRDRVGGLRDGQVWSRGLGSGTTKFEFESWSTRTISGPDGGGKVNTVRRSVGGRSKHSG
jgi:hypothetical protein